MCLILLNADVRDKFWEMCWIQRESFAAVTPSQIVTRVKDGAAVKFRIVELKMFLKYLIIIRITPLYSDRDAHAASHIIKTQ